MGRTDGLQLCIVSNEVHLHFHLLLSQVQDMDGDNLFTGRYIQTADSIVQQILAE